MRKYAVQNFILATVSFLFCPKVSAQKVREPQATNPEWSQPFQPFRIAGNLYYVGTYDLACYLVTTTKGNILINTGLAGSASQIKNNIETLGFKFTDTKILLTTQVHYDHVGAMASIKNMTGAKVMVDEKDAAVLADGGSSDYAFGGNGRMFIPVKADRLLHDSDVIQLGDMKLIMLHHPGHTEGSCSFLFTVKDDRRCYKVLIANMPTIVVEKKLADVTTYPEITSDYAYTLNGMKNISFDIWLASHAGQFKLHDKHHPADAYNPEVFIDKQCYYSAIAELQKQFDEKK
jgi:metallo-beta-lactamase class B